MQDWCSSKTSVKRIFFLGSPPSLISSHWSSSETWHSMIGQLMVSYSLICWRWCLLASPFGDNFWLALSSLRFHWMDETLLSILLIGWSFSCLFGGGVAHCLKHGCTICVFTTGFLISFYSFHDGVTLYFFFRWSWHLPAFWVSSRFSFSLLLSSSVQSTKCFFIWRFCGWWTLISIQKYWLYSPFVVYKINSSVDENF